MAAFSTHQQEIMHAISRKAHEVMPPGATIMLFGSQARGDAHPHSDWDILILLDKDKITPLDEDDIAWPLFTLGWDYDELINPILYTKKDWSDNRMAPFRYNVMADAVSL